MPNRGRGRLSVYGSNLPDLNARLRGDQPTAPPHRHRPMFDIVNRGGPDTTYAEIYIYDEIGFWGVSATDMVHELTGLVCDEIDVHINSPGGDVWDGIAIFNGLLRHSARVNVIVDGLAASAASVIAMAGDTVTMATGSQMMVHDASGAAYGNADTMAQMVDLLNAVSDNLAAIYSARAQGGTAKAWRAVMKAETWYSADEAVESGLADKVDKASKRGEENLAHIDLAAVTEAFGYRYAGRPAAPAPAGPDTPVAAAVPPDPAQPAPTAPAPPVDDPVRTGDNRVAAAVAQLGWDRIAGEAMAELRPPPVRIDPDIFAAAANLACREGAGINFTLPGVEPDPEPTKDLGTAFMEATRL
jgi:ATP-dependent protease ClpP protease subunit